ncbi:MAG: isochorismate lyase [Anaerolineae bacterium]|nr:isochorismate lyase [Anaerolineae bacterium]
MKKPEECLNIQDVRAEIDRLDRQIVSAIGERYRYVQAASKFKTSESSVRAPEREASMLKERRRWAQDAGLNPDVIEKMYRDLISYFVSEELHQWREQSGQ